MSSAEVVSRSGAASCAAEMLSSIPKPTFQRFKVLTVGDEGVGKSCLVKRFCEERFIPKYISTIGVDYGVKRVQVANTESRINFWDLAGGEEYKDVRTDFYKDTNAFVLCYDSCNVETFRNLESVWLQEAFDNGLDVSKGNASGVVCYVIATKADLANGGKRQVSEQEGRKWAQQRGFSFFETSANSGANVASMFQMLFEDMFGARKLPGK